MAEVAKFRITAEAIDAEDRVISTHTIEKASNNDTIETFDVEVDEDDNAIVTGVGGRPKNRPSPSR
jgi:hypothetical protein